MTRTISYFQLENNSTIDNKSVDDTDVLAFLAHRDRFVVCREWCRGTLRQRIDKMTR